MPRISILILTSFFTFEEIVNKTLPTIGLYMLTFMYPVSARHRLKKYYA